MDYEKRKLPAVSETANPAIYKLLVGAVADQDQTRNSQYDARRFVYFSVFTQEGQEFDDTSDRILQTICDGCGRRDLIVKVHTGDPVHAATFARELEPEVYVDRRVYIFEGLYAGLKQPEDSVLLSCVSTAALNPKFMFDQEPYIIFTFRLYHPGEQGIERDEWMAQGILDAYEDKSRVMIPNSMEELSAMIRNITGKGTA